MSSNKVADIPKNGNVLLPASVPMPKTASYKSDASHIKDTVNEYVKDLLSQFICVTKHIDANEKKKQSL